MSIASVRIQAWGLPWVEVISILLALGQCLALPTAFAEPTFLA